MLNQRLMDMKKTLQHELKSNSTEKITKPDASNSNGNNRITTTTSASSTAINTTNNINNSNRTKPKSGHKTDNNGPDANEIDQTIQTNSNTNFVMDDVNFKYLKHVILKFLTSREVRERVRMNFVKII